MCAVVIPQGQIALGKLAQARLVMVLHPLLESRFYAAVQLISQMAFVREAPRAIRVIDEEFS